VRGEGLEEKGKERWGVGGRGGGTEGVGKGWRGEEKRTGGTRWVAGECGASG